MKISTEEENDKAIAVAGALIRKGKERTPEETAELERLTDAIEEFEDKAYPMGV